MNESSRVGRRDDLCAQFVEFLDHIQRDVPRAGNHRRLAGDAVSASSQHVLHEIDRAVSRRFCPDEAAAEREALAGEDAREAVFQTLVLPEHVADFPSAHTDITRRHVGVFTDVPREFNHQ